VKVEVGNNINLHAVESVLAREFDKIKKVHAVVLEQKVARFSL
jgi:hypothetical protein